MDNNIVQIDLGKLDNEILDLKSQIDRLSGELELKEALRGYIKEITIPKSNIISIKSEAHGISTASAIIHDKAKVGISDFIVNLLEGKSGDTAFVIKSYAEYVGAPEGQVSNNVYNALSRLKTSGRIRYEKVEGKGNIWSTNKKPLVSN